MLDRDDCALDGCENTCAGERADYCSYMHACEGEQVFSSGFVCAPIPCPECGHHQSPPFYPCYECGHVTRVENNEPVPGKEKARNQGCICPEFDGYPEEYDAECPIEAHRTLATAGSADG